MTCTNFEKLVSDYLFCRLSPAQLTLFYEHLSGCADCRDFLERYRRVVSLLREERHTT